MISVYELKLEKSPNFDESDEVYWSDINDIANSIDSMVGFKLKEIIIQDMIIIFTSDNSSKLTKDLIRPVLSFHSGNVRFVSLK